MSTTPEHYSVGGIQPWDYCAAKFPESFDDHLLIAAIEYISRAKRKGGIDDIEKAMTNLGHWLTRQKPEPEPADDGRRWRVECYFDTGKWAVAADNLTKSHADKVRDLYRADRPWRDCRIVEDTP